MARKKNCGVKKMIKKSRNKNENVKDKLQYKSHGV